MSKNGSRTNVHQNDASNQNASFIPVLYNFRVTPPPNSNKTFALQQPFATLFDNLITVLWSVYGKKSKIQIGVSQLHWALEFIKCMKVDYGYPESIRKIVNELEDQLIGLYAMVGKKIQKNKQSKELEMISKDDKEIKSKNSATVDTPTPSPGSYISYNEKDIMGKLGIIKMIIDPVTGEAKYLKELNLMGKRRQKKQDPCLKEKNSSKNYMIGALQKILNKATEAETKTGVEELIKELKVENPPIKKT